MAVEHKTSEQSLQELYDEIENRRVDLRENQALMIDLMTSGLQSHVGATVIARLKRIIREDNATLVHRTQTYRAWNAAAGLGRLT